MSDFLKNLKNAVDKGEFNSDAAYKINKISEIAESKKYEDVAEKFSKNMDAFKEKVEPLSVEEMVKLKIEYDESIEKINKEDKLYSIIADMSNTIYDMGILTQEAIKKISKIDEYHQKILEVKKEHIKDENKGTVYDLLNDEIVIGEKMYKDFCINNLNK